MTQAFLLGLRLLLEDLSSLLLLSVGSQPLPLHTDRDDGISCRFMGLPWLPRAHVAGVVCRVAPHCSLPTDHFQWPFYYPEVALLPPHPL